MTTNQPTALVKFGTNRATRMTLEDMHRAIDFNVYSRFHQRVITHKTHSGETVITMYSNIYTGDTLTITEHFDI